MTAARPPASEPNFAPGWVRRKSDAIEKLKTDQDVWVATAAERGIAHLVPLSLCWHAAQVVVAVETSSRTARNAASSGRARLALGPTRDVVIIDAAASVVLRPDIDPAIVDAYRDRTALSPPMPSSAPATWPVAADARRDPLCHASCTCGHDFHGVDLPGAGHAIHRRSAGQGAGTEQ